MTHSIQYERNLYLAGCQFPTFSSTKDNTLVHMEGESQMFVKAIDLTQLFSFQYC